MHGEGIRVDMGEAGFVDHPDWLHTGGVGPCIAVAYLNKTRKCAGLFHGDHVANDQALEDFLDEARSQTRPGDQVEIRLFGGEKGQDPESAQADREAAERMVRDAFPNVQPVMNWIEVDDSSYRIEVDTSPPQVTGELVPD